jgi:hypothetical protein
MTTAEVIGVGKEKQLCELKLMYENKLNTPTKMVKCFGKDNYEKDWMAFKIRCLDLMNECKHKC